MKPLLVIVLSYLLVIAAAGDMVGIGPFAGILCMFAVAFFDGLLGRRKALSIVAALTVWSMADETVPWGVSILHAMIRGIATISSDLEFPIYAFSAILFLCGMLIGLFIFNLSQLYVFKYLVKRWKLKERIGVICV